MFEPVFIADRKGAPLGTIKENDAVIFFNFREDRARQLAQAFVEGSLRILSEKSGRKTSSSPP